MEQRPLDDILKRVRAAGQPKNPATQPPGEDQAQQPEHHEQLAEPHGEQEEHEEDVDDPEAITTDNETASQSGDVQVPRHPWNVSDEENSSEADTDNNLYKEPTVVYEDSNVKAVIQKTHLKRQKVFSLSDHLYVAKILPKHNMPDKKNPFVLNLLSVFKQIITVIVIALRDYYDSNLTEEERQNPENYHQQIYATLIGSSLSRGINSGNFSLRSDTDLICYSICNSVLNFLQSYEEVRLDNSWQLYFRVLSVGHLRYRKYVKRNILQNVGYSADPDNRRTLYIFRAPIGFEPHHPFCFKNKCFIISFLIGIVHKQRFKNSLLLSNWAEICEIHYMPRMQR